MTVGIQSASKASWSGTLDSSSPFGHNLPVTVAAGSDRVLVFVGTNPEGSGFLPTAPTFNGVSMTLLGATVSVANNGDAIYYMVNPPVGTYDLFIGAGFWYGQRMFMSAAVFEGVDQTTPFGTPSYDGHSFSTNPLNINITAASGAATLYAASEYNMPSFVEAAGQSVFGTFAGSKNSIYANHSYKLGASTSVGASWTGGSTQAAHMAVVVNAAAASGTAGNATGTLAAIAIDAASATSTGKASSTGSLPSITLAAVTATAVGGAGTPSLTLPALKNNTGAVLASETGATAHVYTLAGALVVTKTAQTTNGSGVMVITDAALTSATQYRVVIVLASGAEGMDKVTAA